MNTKEIEIRETLIETSLASAVAIEILNDLLLYDKLQSGLVELKKEEVGVLEFVSQSIETFAVQIRAKQMNLSFINPPNNSTINSSSSSSSSSSSRSSNNSSGQNTTIAPTAIFPPPLSILSSSSKSISSNKSNCSTHNAAEPSVDSRIPLPALPAAAAINNNDRIHVDKTKLSQVIRNLMSNAIKFTP
jgi:signal transduction histidine kinase